MFEFLLSISNDTWNIFLLALTFGAILWYSVETRRLRIETSELRKIQRLPYVTFFMEDSWDKDRKIVGQHFYIKNSGQGVAKNISIIPTNFYYKYGLDKKSDRVFEVKSFDSMSSLSSKEIIEVFAEKDEKDNVGDNRTKKVDPKYIRIPDGTIHKVKVEFYDLLRIKHFTEQDVCPNFSKVICDSFDK